MNLDRIIAVRNSKTVYRDGDKVYKVFDKSYSKADVLNEALNQARIEETGLHIPKILGVTMTEGKWTIITEFIEGKTLAQLMAEEPQKRDEYLDLFVSLQLLMHSKTCPGLNQLKDKMNLKIDQTDLLATVRYDLHMRIEAMPTHNKVCHGDYNPSNIIITEDGTPYILDWSHATQGNSSADAAMTFLQFCLEQDQKGAKDYLELFCQKSKTEKQYIYKWMPIVEAVYALKGNEREKGLLGSWTELVDQETSQPA
ncbi:MAG: phosphotransferase [Lachnospiraceae bacterium]|nr:phosphotransferase [Lachnospiraceae bacterium]